jgi:Rhodopirellula transposase DDE domain
MIDSAAIRKRYEAVVSYLDERQLRLFAASEAQAAGRGGILAVSLVTGIARSTIGRGLHDLREGVANLPQGRVRRSGGGRKAAIVKQPGLLEALNELIVSAIRGDPEAPLLWVSRSQRHLASELAKRGYHVHHTVVGRLLKDLGYSLQANAKTREGNRHPDRNEQFEHINACIVAFHDAGQPAISVDTKKKELIGDFKNGGRELRPKGEPEEVRVHDFIIPDKGKVAPYGVYDINANEGWVSVGVDHDTAAFAVEAIRRWWYRMGQKRYPNADRLMITADCGGSNGSRVRLWKIELQTLANETGMAISVTHHPPGTSKWNRIEHRMFSYMSQNWRAKPLVSHQAIVQLIAATKTNAGLTIDCEIDPNIYPKGITISNKQMAGINITGHHFHPEWNYTIKPVAGTSKYTTGSD